MKAWICLSPVPRWQHLPPFVKCPSYLHLLFSLLNPTADGRTEAFHHPQGSTSRKVDMISEDLVQCGWKWDAALKQIWYRELAPHYWTALLVWKQGDEMLSWCLHGDQLSSLHSYVRPLVCSWYLRLVECVCNRRWLLKLIIFFQNSYLYTFIEIFRR
jgi:hypothetical protein